MPRSANAIFGGYQISVHSIDFQIPQCAGWWQIIFIFPNTIVTSATCPNNHQQSQKLEKRVPQWSPNSIYWECHRIPFPHVGWGWVWAIKCLKQIYAKSSQVICAVVCCSPELSGSAWSAELCWWSAWIGILMSNLYTTDGLDGPLTSTNCIDVIVVQLGRSTSCRDVETRRNSGKREPAKAITSHLFVFYGNLIAINGNLIAVQLQFMAMSGTIKLPCAMNAN